MVNLNLRNIFLPVQKMYLFIILTYFVLCGNDDNDNNNNTSAKIPSTGILSIFLFYQ